MLDFRIVATIFDWIDSDTKVKSLKQVKVYIFWILFSKGFQKTKFKWCQPRESKIVGNIQLLLRDRRNTYVNHLKCNFAIILRHRKLQFWPWSFQTCRVWMKGQNFYRWFGWEIMVNSTYRINFVAHTVITFGRNKIWTCCLLFRILVVWEPYRQNLSCLWLKIMAKLHFKWLTYVSRNTYLLCQIFFDSPAPTITKLNFLKSSWKQDSKNVCF